MQAPKRAASLSVSSIDAAPAKPKASGRGAILTQEEMDEKRRLKNEKDKERRRKKRAEEKKKEKEPSPPSTPSPSPAKTKKRAPSTSTPGKEPAKKKSKALPADARDYFGIAPSLAQANLVLEGRALFQGFARFATTDPSVNQAMAVFLARAPTSYNPSEPPSTTFKTWLNTNAAVFLQLAEVLETFTRSVHVYDKDIREAIDEAYNRPEKGGEPSVADEDSDARQLEDLDDETRAFMLDIGAVLPQKKKASPPSPHVVKAAPVRNDPLFTEFIKLAARKPQKGSKFFIALGELGPNALTLPAMLAIIKEISPTNDKIEAHKKTLGNYLAAFKWLFPTASA